MSDDLLGAQLKGIADTLDELSNAVSKFAVILSIGVFVMAGSLLGIVLAIMGSR